MLGLGRFGRALITVMFLFGTVTGCTIDSHLQQTIKIDDPFKSESEQQFLGLIINYLALPEGESTFVRLPGGKTLLIDTGGARDTNAILSHLSERKVIKLDYCIITNDQPAHAEGYRELANVLQIETVLMPKLTAASIQAVVPIASDKKTVYLAEGDKLQLDEQVSLHVLHPSEHLFLSPQDNSLVFQLVQDQLRFLFTSGIGEAAEERLLERHKEELPSAVLKVAQQGSNQSSSQSLLTAVDPQVAVIQTGRSHIDMHNGEEEIVERLNESWAETYITSHHGTITILSNGKDYRVLKQKKK